MEYLNDIKQINQSRIDCVETSTSKKIEKSLTEEDKKKLIEKGICMPCGSFPVLNKKDLERVIKSVEKLDHKAAQKWLIEKAEKFEALDLIPEGWDKIEKSMDYNKDQFTFKKTGKEIKNGLSNVISFKEVEKQKYHKEMMDKITETGFPPEKEYDDYSIKNYKHLLTYIPQRYCYSKINGQTIPEEKSNSMQKYNNYASKYIKTCISLLKLQTLHNNIEENKNFTLNTEQLVTLGL